MSISIDMTSMSMSILTQENVYIELIKAKNVKQYYLYCLANFHLVILMT